MVILYSNSVLIHGQLLSITFYHYSTQGSESVAHLQDAAHSCAEGCRLSLPHISTLARPLSLTSHRNSLPSEGSSQYFHESGSPCAMEGGGGEGSIRDRC